MFAPCVNMYTTLRRVTQITALSQAHHSKSYPTTGFAHSAVWAKMYSKRRNPRHATTAVEPTRLGQL